MTGGSLNGSRRVFVVAFGNPVTTLTTKAMYGLLIKLIDGKVCSNGCT